jgi:hypothetical protein
MASLSATAGPGTGTGTGTIAPHSLSIGNSHNQNFVDYSVPGTGTGGGIYRKMDDRPSTSTSTGGAQRDEGDMSGKKSTIKGKERDLSADRDDGSDSDDQKYVPLSSCGQGN